MPEPFSGEHEGPRASSPLLRFGLFRSLCGLRRGKLLWGASGWL